MEKKLRLTHALESEFLFVLIKLLKNVQLGGGKRVSRFCVFNIRACSLCIFLVSGDKHSARAFAPYLFKFWHNSTIGFLKHLEPWRLLKIPALQRLWHFFKTSCLSIDTHSLSISFIKNIVPPLNTVGINIVLKRI